MASESGAGHGQAHAAKPQLLIVGFYLGNDLFDAYRLSRGTPMPQHLASLAASAAAWDREWLIEEATDRAMHGGEIPTVRRWLAGVPDATTEGVWETRKTGSAAIECALVASGLLQVARFKDPNIWDVAGGVAGAVSPTGLGAAGGGAVYTGGGGLAFSAPGTADARARLRKQ